MGAEIESGRARKTESYPALSAASQRSVLLWFVIGAAKEDEQDDKQDHDDQEVGAAEEVLEEGDRHGFILTDPFETGTSQARIIEQSSKEARPCFTCSAVMSSPPTSKVCTCLPRALGWRRFRHRCLL